MGTFSAKAQTVDHQWVIVDAENQVMGRLASMLAKRLRGKHLPVYTPHVDTGDFIVLVNVEKMRVTGNKAKDKIYYRHTEHPGGIKSDTYEELMAKDPRKVLMKAVKGMLPKGPLGRSMLKKLKVYVGPDHPHQAQQPREVKE